MGPRAAAATLLCVFGIALRGHGSDEQATVRKAFQQARELESQGKLPEAFMAYLAIPGGEHAAARLARPKAKEFLPVVRKLLDDAPPSVRPRARLLEAELLLALGKKESALDSYRHVVSQIGQDEAQGWDQGFLPHDYYPVEPAREEQLPPGATWHYFRPLEPFICGPGSHRDNWFIRRFIALEAWADARSEFARIWAIHEARKGALTHRSRDQLPEPSGGFNGRGLQFAIDYAYFLKRAGDLDQALAVLAKPLLLIDMDRNPNLDHLERWSPYYSAGVSRKEFIRLTYGESKALGREGEVVALIEQLVEKGENRGRRLLARVRFHQGQVEQATSLELAYIEKGGFDQVSTAYRQGQVHEGSRDFAAAAAVYERALTLPYESVDLPDPDEDVFSPDRTSARFPPIQPFLLPTRDGTPVARAAFHVHVAERLIRIYKGLGQTEEVRDTTRRHLEFVLRKTEADPRRLDRLSELERMRGRFNAQGHEALFLRWAKKYRKQAESLRARANLCWIVRDYRGTIRALVAQVHAPAQQGQRPGRTVRYFGQIESYKRRFQEAGKGKLKRLLKALVKANPDDVLSRLQLLDLRNRWRPREVIPLLELIVAGKAPRGGGDRDRDRGRACFYSQFDAAYRLMRLYERTEQFDKLRALGLRAARAEKPFYVPGAHRDANRNDTADDVHLCLSLAVQYADEAAYQDELAKALEGKPWPWSSALEQLRRRQKGRSLTRSPLPPFGWANVPKGVTLVASTENVLALVRDDRYVYTGHPWGVAVYDFHGEAVTRVALSAPVHDLAALDGCLWVPTPEGLCRIDREDWSVALLSGALHISKSLRSNWHTDKERTEEYHRLRAAHWVAADAETVWVGFRRCVWQYTPRNCELVMHRTDELPRDKFPLCTYGFTDVIDKGDCVWARTSRGGFVRYDKKTNSWGSPLRWRGHWVRLTGVGRDQTWGSVRLSLGQRPCVVDAQTLAVTPILLEGDLPRQQGGGAESFVPIGTADGKLVFEARSSGGFVLDRASMKLRPVGRRRELKAPLRRFRPIYDDRRGHRLVDLDRYLAPQTSGPTPQQLAALVDDPYATRITTLTLPDGTLALGRSYRYSAQPLPGRMPFRWNVLARATWALADVQHLIPGLDFDPWDGDVNRYDLYRRLREDAGGLFFVPPGGAVARVSSRPRSDTLRSERVLDLCFDRARNVSWLCTPSGLAALDEHDRVSGRYSTKNGLVANRVASGATLGGKVYFAAGWEEAGGGLIAFDPETSVFTAYGVADGLNADKLDAVSARLGRLRLTYAPEWGRGIEDNRLYPPGYFSPKTGRHWSWWKPRNLKGYQLARYVTRYGHEPLPYLGGCIRKRYRRNGKTYLCGTLGLVILDDGKLRPAAVAKLQATVIESPTRRFLAAVKARWLPESGSFRELGPLLASDNPYVRGMALKQIVPPAPGADERADYITALIGCSVDSFRSVQVEALRRLARATDEEAVRYLDALSGAPKPRLRVAAALAIAEHARNGGSLEPLKGLLANRDRHVRAIGALTLAKLGHVPSLSPFEEILSDWHLYDNPCFGELSLPGGISVEAVYRALAPHADRDTFALFLKYPFAGGSELHAMLGKSLREHPEAVELLLGVYDPHSRRNDDARMVLARAVLPQAGPPILPLLHKALRSEDRVVRSNAARACGGIGDRSSIPPLIQALDLESGLSRASIVWALGELRAREAIPELVKLYTDVRNDEQTRRGAGFRMAQSGAALRAQYDCIRNLDTLGADWARLSAQVAAPAIDPRRNEELLSTSHLLEAVEKIGPAAAQDFYRSLAGEDHSAIRLAAARGLGEGRPDDVAKNVPILRNLLTDDGFRVGQAAAVSLLLLGDETARHPVREWLRSHPSGILEELKRIEDPAALAFARRRIRAVARGSGRGNYDARQITRRMGW